MPQTKKDQPDKTLTSLDVVLRCFVSALDADSGIILGRGEQGKIELLSAAGYAAQRATVPWTRGSFLGQALSTPGVSLEKASGFRDSGPVPDAWHAVACRIEGQSGPEGAVYAGFERPSHLSRAELTWAAESHARLAGLCMSGSGDGVSQVLRSSGVDQLTGCLRYERVIEALKGEVQRSIRQGHELSCCFSTSITSRRSTTSMATSSAIAFSPVPELRCLVRQGASTASGASAATSL